jgi:hypothetical protein
MLKETFENEPGVLWGGYGIIDYVTVCVICQVFLVVIVLI